MIKRLVVLCTVLSGCGLYWGGGNGDDVCTVDKTPVQPEVRDPSTGICESIDGGGGGGCGPCEPCVDEALPGTPNWPSCSGSCDSLDEADCLATAACHAEYESGPPNGGQIATTNQFVACWDTLPGVLSTGTCAGLDAWTCADHDNCASLMTQGNGTTTFDQCIDEPSTCGTTSCGTGSHCAEACPPCDSVGCMCQPTCVPDTTCLTTTCDPGSTCVTNCDTGTCVPSCVPMDHVPGTCSGTVTCNSAPPACPSNTTAGIANGCYTGYCIPSADCGPHDPGLCYTAAACQIAPPQCPSGSKAGVSGLCWSGYCIPVADCETPACETLATEAGCTARADCSPVYNGTSCTCDSNGCTCQTLTFESCVTAAGGL